MTRSGWFAAVALLVAAGCPPSGGGGGGAGGAMVFPAPPVGAADIPAMRALLDRYSPMGRWIVNADDTLPRTFAVGRRTITLSNSGDFASYFDDGAPDRIVDYMSTSVHEVYHAITTRLGYQVQVEARATELVDGDGHTVGGSPMFVPYNVSFPASEMAATYPANARAFRFSTYVSPSQPTQSTQQHGVFGLLEEWTAYLHGGRVILDFWPWLRDEAPRSREVYVRYRSRFHEIWVPHAEFKLFILHYLLHARTHRPDVYRGLLANDAFRRAFTAADDAWAELLRDASALEPAIRSVAAERGAATTSYSIDEAYPTIAQYIASEPYRSLLAELRRR